MNRCETNGCGRYAPVRFTEYERSPEVCPRHYTDEQRSPFADVARRGDRP